jgi:hypothetical protein
VVPNDHPVCAYGSFATTLNSYSYIGERNVSFSYWDVDGTMSTAQGRTFGGEDGYGILNMSWTGPILLFFDVDDDC